MKPEIEVLGITIKTFGVMFALGFLACGAVLHRRLRELGKPVDWAYEIVFAALIGGVVGARLYYLIENWDTVQHDLVGSTFSGSGLVWYGGAIGGAIGVVAWMYWRHTLELQPARRVRHGARARLRDRADRLPGLRRRRLRDPLEPAVGDGLPARHGAPPRQACACSPRRSTRP